MDGNGFAQFLSLQICRKHVRGESGARIVNAIFAYQKHGIVNMEAFAIFAPDLLLSYCIFAIYLPRANLSKSIFSSSDIKYGEDFYGFQSMIF